MSGGQNIILVRRLAVIVVIMTFGLMVLGSWVKATGSGLACPDWPACYGQWLPPFPSAENGGLDPSGPDAADGYTQAQVLYEWTHRLVASLLSIPLLTFAWFAYRDRAHHPSLRHLPLVALGILVIQIGLGGITVVGRNAAPLTTAHLATATLFLMVVTMAAMFAFLRPTVDGKIVKAAKPRKQTQPLFPGEEPR